MLQRLRGLLRAPLPLPRPGSGFTWRLEGPAPDTRPVRNKRQALERYAGWDYAAASTLAQDVRAAPWELWQRDGAAKAGWRRLPPERIPGLLRRPNGLQSWPDLVELSQLHLELTGEAYWHLLRRDGWLEGLELLHPHWVEAPLLDEAGRQLRGWQVQVPGRSPQVLPAEEVVFLRYPHPLEPLRGASPVEAFALSHDMDLHARAYGAALLKNRATPELVITSEEELTPEQAEVLRERWLERYRDPARGPAVLGRAAKVQQLGFNLKDLAFLELAELSRDQIFAVYKLPASKVGLTSDVNRANAEAADATYRRNAILPRLRRIEEAVNLHLLPQLGPGVANLWYEYENPVEEDRSYTLRRAEAMLKAGAITLNRYRDLLGEDPLPDGELYLQPPGARWRRKVGEG
ncbi:phage portal protein [Aquibaculum sediminis]|uniref:phage portal protein n=1 Tax=Aquibaculum sediminis TaxID=3231907 RepID=UPI0034546645